MYSGSCLFELLVTDFSRNMSDMQDKKGGEKLKIYLFEDDPNKFETLVIFFHASNFISITPNLR